MIENFNKTYTPPLWDCIGFKFKEDDVLYKINNITKVYRPLMRSIPDSNIKYHLIYDPSSIPALVLRVIRKDDSKIAIDEIFPCSLSKSIPVYKSILEKIDDINLYFSIYNNDKKLLTARVFIPLDQIDSLKIEDKSDDPLVLKEKEQYKMSFYLMTPIVSLYPDIDSFKEEIKNSPYVISDFSNIENKQDKDLNKYYNNHVAIGGKIYSVKIAINHFTGRRFFEITLIYQNTKIVVYTPSYSTKTLPLSGQYIVCKLCQAFGDMFSDNTTTPEASTLKSIENCLFPILEFDVDYLHGFDNTIKIKKDAVFDGEIKIKYINVQLYRTTLRITSEVYKDKNKPQKISLARDKNFKNEIEELSKLNFKEHREIPENLVEGAYWFVCYNDSYIEGYENYPYIIDDIKKIIGFDEIINVIKSKFQDQDK